MLFRSGRSDQTVRFPNRKPRISPKHNKKKDNCFITIQINTPKGITKENSSFHTGLFLSTLHNNSTNLSPQQVGPYLKTPS